VESFLEIKVNFYREQGKSVDMRVYGVDQMQAWGDEAGISVRFGGGGAGSRLSPKGDAARLKKMQASLAESFRLRC
jgi:hypothetical protein